MFLLRFGVGCLVGVCLSVFGHTSVLSFENPATRDNYSNSGLVILINEVSFRDDEADWVELRVIDDGNGGGGVNLKGFSLQDDGVFKEVEDDFEVFSGDYVLLEFNSNQKDKSPFLYSAKKGLTSTTEQIVLLDKGGVILDVLCWVNDSPAKSEVKDFEQIFDSKEWLVGGIDLCFSSLLVKENQSVGRRGVVDSNSVDDWMVMSVPSPGRENLLVEFDVDSFGDNELRMVSKENGYVLEIVMKNEEEKNQKSSSIKNAKNQKMVMNGDLSEEIMISEFLSNPEGTDKGNEWIELVNFGDTDVRLGGWQLDDSDGGSKPFVFTDQVIRSGETIVIEDGESKLALNNGVDAVRLFDFQGHLIDEISYDGAIEGKTFARMGVRTDEGVEFEWQWTEEISRGERNSEFFVLRGKIMRAPDAVDPYSLEIESGNKRFKVNYKESLLAASLAQVTFLKGSELELVVLYDGEEYFLQKFHVLAQVDDGRIDGIQKFQVYIVGGLFILTIILFGVLIWRFKKFREKEDDKLFR